MRLIDADKFLTYLIYSKHIDGLTCGEVKEAVEMCKVDVLDKIRAEIEGIVINGQIDEHTLFTRSGQEVKKIALEIIDKHITESEDKEAYDKLNECKELVDKYNVANNRPDISDCVAVTLNKMKSERTFKE